MSISLSFGHGFGTTSIFKILYIKNKTIYYRINNIKTVQNTMDV